jgi:Alpha/beta hydrolase domain
VITPVSGTPNLLLGAYDLATLGYGAEEFFISGTAGSHSGETADYVTRIVVCRPADDADFTGTVIVEWLNVSGGIDAPAVWFMAHRGIVRAGFAYVAVSAQQVGVEGGLSLIGADMSLKAQDPERYSRLHHPGDAFSYDIFSQVGSSTRMERRQLVVQCDVVGGQPLDQGDVGVGDEGVRVGRIHDHHANVLVGGHFGAESAQFEDEVDVQQIYRRVVDRRAADSIRGRDSNALVAVIAHAARR